MPKQTIYRHCQPETNLFGRADGRSFGPGVGNVKGESVSRRYRTTVFVVDDELAVRDSLKWLLEAAGYRVVTYGSAGEFLDDYRPDRPGCLLADVCMPGIGGIELLRELRNRKSVLPVVILTGYSEAQIASAALEAGAMTFLEKPFNDRELLSIVEEALTENLCRLGLTMPPELRSAVQTGA